MRFSIRETLFLVMVPLGCLDVFAADRDHDFHLGHRPTHGNEASLRPTHLGVGRWSNGGNGCPGNSMRVVFAPDNLSFSMLFDQFIAKIDIDKNIKRDSIQCDTIIPIQIPAGVQMEITQVDYRGFAGLPNKARARLHSIFNFRGRGEDRDRINMKFAFQGPTTGDFQLSSDTLESNGRTAQSEVSPCGGDVSLRASVRLLLVSPNGEQASITIDSIDGLGSARAIYYVNWRSCTL